MTINTLKMPNVVVYGFLAIVVAVQLSILLYVHNNPGYAADAIMNRTPTGYALLMALKVFKIDDEADLTRSGLSRDAIADACRFRANYGMQWSVFSAVLLVVVFVVHSGFNRSS